MTTNRSKSLRFSFRAQAEALLRGGALDDYSIALIKRRRRASTKMRSLVREMGADVSLASERGRLLLTLGQVGRHFGEHGRAHRDLNNAFNSAVCTDDDALVLNILYERGRLKSLTDDHSGAFVDLKQALRSAMTLCGPTHLRVADIHLGLAETRMNDPRGQFKLALKHYRIAQGIAAAVHESSARRDLVMAEATKGIAHCLRRQGDLPGTREHLNEALRIFVRHLGERHPSTCAVYHNLGSLGLSTDFETFIPVGIDERTSQEYLKIGLDSTIAAFGNATRNAAIGHQWLSQMMYINGKLASALKHRQSAIAIWKGISGPRGLDLVYSYYWRGRIFEKMAERDTKHNAALRRQALADFRRTVAIGENQPFHRRINFNIDYMRRANEKLTKHSRRAP